ncbi:MAG: archease [Candidatus Zixiibacteriota bacterium]
MTFNYRFLPDVALADAAFAVEADSWSELFLGAALATTSVMVALDDLRSDLSRILELTAASVEQLLYDWLSEIVYLKDTEGLLVKMGEVAVAPGDTWQVHAVLHGDRIDRDRQRLGQDVKAITYHLYEVVQDGDSYRARVVLDI